MMSFLHKYRILISLFILLILVEAVILAANWRSLMGWGIAVSGMSTPTAIPTSSDPQIRALEESLKDNSLSREAREGIVEKLSMAKRMATQQAAGAALERNKKKAPPLPTAPAVQLINPLTMPDQIFEGSQGMISPSTAQISNCWQGVRNGKSWEIYAGALAENAEQGVLIVVADDPEKPNRTMKFVNAPGKSGLLRILSADETVMTLQAANGNKLRFSLKTMKFLK
jgi:hypothetical protein